MAKVNDEEDLGEENPSRGLPFTAPMIYSCSYLLAIRCRVHALKLLEVGSRLKTSRWPDLVPSTLGVENAWF